MGVNPRARCLTPRAARLVSSSWTLSGQGAFVKQRSTCRSLPAHTDKCGEFAAAAVVSDEGIPEAAIVAGNGGQHLPPDPDVDADARNDSIIERLGCSGEVGARVAARRRSLHREFARHLECELGTG